MSVKCKNTHLENLPKALLDCLQQLPSAVWQIFSKCHAQLCHEPVQIVALFIPAQACHSQYLVLVAGLAGQASDKYAIFRACSSGMPRL
jgi:hypothetical protein